MDAGAEALKQAGNECFQKADFVGADKFYTQAIIKDPTNAAFFTNRALARVRMEQWEAVVTDCEKAIELVPTSLKAYTYLGQAQLALNRPHEALTSSQKAYNLAVSQRSRSLRTIAATCLEAKKKRWEYEETLRIERESRLLRETLHMIEEAGERRLRELGMVDGTEEAADVRRETEQRRREIEEVFGQAEAQRLKRREVPDWAIDNITFAVMVDPVITKHGHSYDRATIMDHLRRSETDPLTREPLTEADLRPNLGLKAACDEFLKENGWAVDW